MTAIIICFLLFCAMVFLAAEYLVNSAPLGYEDKEGFHYGRPPEDLPTDNKE